MAACESPPAGLRSLLVVSLARPPRSKWRSGDGALFPFGMLCILPMVTFCNALINPRIYFAFYEGNATRTNLYSWRKSTFLDKSINPGLTTPRAAHNFWKLYEILLHLFSPVGYQGLRESLKCKNSCKSRNEIIFSSLYCRSPATRWNLIYIY